MAKAKDVFSKIAGPLYYFARSSAPRAEAALQQALITEKPAHVNSSLQLPALFGLLPSLLSSTGNMHNAQFRGIPFSSRRTYSTLIETEQQQPGKQPEKKPLGAPHKECTLVVRMVPNLAVYDQNTISRTLHGPATVLLPGAPIATYKSGFGVLYLKYLDKVSGTPRNASSHAFGWNSGSSENVPSSWDAEEAQQEEFSGKRLAKEILKQKVRTGETIPHNEVRLHSKYPPYAFVATSRQAFEGHEFKEFEAVVKKEYSEAKIKRAIYNSEKGCLAELTQDGRLVPLELPEGIKIYDSNQSFTGRVTRSDVSYPGIK